MRVKRLQSDWKEVDVEMNLHFWNANFVGTHYGGSLYSMAARVQRACEDLMSAGKRLT